MIEREYRSLEMVADSFPKYVVSLDKGFETTNTCIKWINIIDFFLDTSVLGGLEDVCWET